MPMRNCAVFTPCSFAVPVVPPPGISWLCTKAMSSSSARLSARALSIADSPLRLRSAIFRQIARVLRRTHENRRDPREDLPDRLPDPQRLHRLQPDDALP